MKKSCVLDECMKKESLPTECLAEFIGTFILVLFGVGVVQVDVFTGAFGGLWQIASVWAVAIALAIYAIGAISGAHINPAITAAMFAFRGFPARKLAPYMISQLCGAFAAGALLYMLYSGAIAHFETANEIVRGQPGSELSAMAFGEYFPNPGLAKANGWDVGVVRLPLAMFAEFFGTMILAFFVFAITDDRNKGAPTNGMQPIFVGLTVAVLIAIIAPITQAGFNPARDFGPRLFAFFAGWGDVAIPGPRGGFFTVYILSPLLGAVLGGGIYTFIKKQRQKND
jgi:glycerol uptake facilitator protein